MMKSLFAPAALLLLMTASSVPVSAAKNGRCPVELIVLGTGQDGGVPQLGHDEDPAWRNSALRRNATSLGIVERRTGRRWLFEATPDMREQLHRFDAVAHPQNGLGIDGIFLTHAHIGHYAGLMFLGHESAGASSVPVYAMPRMSAYLSGNGPWSQLVRYQNIALQPLANGETVTVGPLRVTPFLVPHRQEYSEVVGFRIDGPRRKLLFIPDIDSWSQWDSLGVRIEDEIARANVAYLDGTFYANGEIPGRDMRGFPHPFISDSLRRFASLPASERAKIHFIHLNHSNPARFSNSAARRAVTAAGSRIAEEMETQCL